VRPALLRLVADQPGIDGVLRPGQALPAGAAALPAGPLPQILGTTPQPLPAQTPYLEANRVLARHWRSRFARPGLLRVGVAWGGRPLLEAMTPLFGIEGTAFFSLETEAGSRTLAPLRRRAGITDVSTRITDAADLAAAILELDLIVGPDGPAVHIAGALGRPAAVLLTRPAHWRWLAEGERTPWYPSARLLRQQRLDDWSAPVAALAAELQQAVSDAS